MKEAHKKAIEAATEAGAIINFDPNLRFALWEHITLVIRQPFFIRYKLLLEMKKVKDKAVEKGKDSLSYYHYHKGLSGNR